MNALTGLSLTRLIDMLTKRECSIGDIYTHFHTKISKHNAGLNVFLAMKDPSSDTPSDLSTPLCGLPIALKDNICTIDFPTTASSKVLDGYRSPYDATVTRHLRKAGAYIVGKTNMDAWAHGSSTETSDYGCTRNPYNTQHVPGGSSGGSAAAVAAGLVPAAIGTETAGSIRQPAAWSGVVGLKPTYGRVSRYGIVAMGSSWDCPGPMTQTVADAALLLELIAGNDPYDATSSDKPVPSLLDATTSRKNMTIGYAESFLEDCSEDVRTAFDRCIQLLKDCGHTVRPIRLMSPQLSISTYMLVQRSEVSSNLARYDGIRFGSNRASFGHEAVRRIMLGSHALSSGYHDQYYTKAQKVRYCIAQDFARAFEEVDAIFAPTTPMTATKIGDSAAYSFYGEMMDILTEPAAAAGIPALSLPVGLDRNGLPVGMQFMANHYHEATLITVASHLEEACAFDRLSVMHMYE